MDPTRPEDFPEQSEHKFAEYTERHYEYWVDFFRQRHSRDDIYPILVTGFDMAENSAMVAYSHNESCKREGFVDFSIFGCVFPTFRGIWRANFKPHHHHWPPRDQPAIHGQSGDAGSLANECNQCVFIRYYTMRTRGWWMASRKELVKVGARPRGPGSGNNRGGPSSGPTTPPSGSSITTGGGGSFTTGGGGSSTTGGGGPSTTGGGDALEGQKGPTAGGTDSEPDVAVQNSENVRSLPCSLFSTLTFFRTRDMAFGISSQITYSR